MSHRWKTQFFVAVVLVFAAGWVLSQDKPPAKNPPGEADKEATILKALEQPADFAFKETTLEDVAEHLAKTHKLSIRFNRRELEDAGIVPSDTLITRSVKGLKLRYGLNLILQELGLTWVIRNETLEITSKDDADLFLVTRVYPVADLVLPPDDPQPEDGAEDYDTLIEIIQNTVSPDSWQDAGGPGSISPLRRTLVMSQTQATHRQIAALLAALRQARVQLAKGEGAARFAVIKCYDAETEDRIRPLLRRRIALAYIEKPLSDVTAEIGKRNGVAIIFNRRALEDAGIVPENTLITLKVSDVSLASALTLILADLGLAPIVDNGLLTITSKDDAYQQLLTRVYPVQDIVQKDGEDMDSLVEAIERSVSPDSWMDAGGSGMIEPSPEGESLVIFQTARYHAEVERVLAMVRKTLPMTKTPPRPADKKQDDDKVSLKVYYLVPTQGEGTNAKLVEEVVKLVQEMVAPESWKAKDGRALIRALPDRLVVRQTGRIHQEVRKLLEELDVLLPFNPGGFGPGELPGQNQSNPFF